MPASVVIETTQLATSVSEVAVSTHSWMFVFAIATSFLAVALVYSASPRQRWLRVPLPSFPSYVSAVLAAVVGLKAWSEALRLWF